MSWCKNKFWLENPPELFCNVQLIPLTNMSLHEQMNCLTRLVLLIFILLLLVKPRISFVFLILSLLFIIIIYYIQKRTMDNFTNGYQKEHYKNVQATTCNAVPLDNSTLTRKENGSNIINRIQNNPWCNDEVKLSPNNPNYVSKNQRLAGPPNPKTLIAPVVTPRLAELDYWRANNLVNHSHINSESQTDLYLSGYKVSNCCGRTNACLVPVDEAQFENDVIEGFSNTMYEGITDSNRPVRKHCDLPKYTPIQSPTPTTMLPYSKIVNGTDQCHSDTHHQDGLIEGYDGRAPLPKYPHSVPIQSPIPSTTVRRIKEQNIKEGFETSQLIRPNESGWVNTTCGYNPKQVYESNLPSNYQAGNCEQTAEMKEYNKNLFTQNIQPDVYTRSEVIEPINSNIGISFTQQFEPTTVSRKDGKGLTYTEHDPRIYDPKEKPRELPMGMTEADIYDPRFSGYGTSYRAYNDTNIGQTRFYYDDIDAVRMPNYLVRSNIDFASYADSYGPLNKYNKYGNIHNSDIRALAQDSFLRSSLEQRDDLQYRLMRKRNNELWQLRKYPKSSGGSRHSRAC